MLQIAMLDVHAGADADGGIQLSRLALYPRLPSRPQIPSRILQRRWLHLGFAPASRPPRTRLHASLQPLRATFAPACAPPHRKLYQLAEQIV